MRLLDVMHRIVPSLLGIDGAVVVGAAIDHLVEAGWVFEPPIVGAVDQRAQPVPIERTFQDVTDPRIKTVHQPAGSCWIVGHDLVTEFIIGYDDDIRGEPGCFPGRLRLLPKRCKGIFITNNH